MKRILVLLTVAAVFSVAMAMSALSAGAAPNCAQVTNNPNCEPVVTTSTSAPGQAEESKGKAGTKNPNFTTTTSTTTVFKPGK